MPPYNWMSYEEAKAYVYSLKFNRKEDYIVWVKTENRPENIPATPDKVYKNKGWLSWGDFLGTGKIANQNRQYCTFDETKDYIQAIGIRTQIEWRQWSKTDARPLDIPANPPSVYLDQWNGWGDFLGTGVIANQDKEWMIFEQSRALARSLGFKNRSEWNQWVKSSFRPKDIPAYPNEVYSKDGWINWGDFLGTGNLAPKNFGYRSLIEARAFARMLGFKSTKEWNIFAKSEERPKDIPKLPHQAYDKKGWVSYSDFLGVKIHKEFRPFEEARNFTKKLELQSIAEWKIWARSLERPEDIPKRPDAVYKNLGWVDYSDFLGVKIIANKNRKYRSFEQAKLYVKSLGINSSMEWRQWSKTKVKPSDIPANPSQTYSQDWNGWGDFLGTGTVANQNRQSRSFDEAREYIALKDLKTKEQYIAWAKTNERPVDIPANPRDGYVDNWQGWGHFLGTGKIANQKRKFRDFTEARDYARSLGFKEKKEWEAWLKTSERPSDIPYCPNEVYESKGWTGWNDWLGVRSEWNINNIRVFVESLVPHIATLTPAELYVIFQQNGLFDVSYHNGSKSFIQALKTGRFPKEELEKFLAGEDSLVDKFFSDADFSLEDHYEQNVYQSEEDLDKKIISESDCHETLEELPNIETADILAALDSKIFCNLDNEVMDYFVKSAVTRIWQHAFFAQAEAFKQLETYSVKGAYSESVKKQFMQEYQNACDLVIPAGYSFSTREDKMIEEPNLMQRYTAALVQSRKRLGNWSGTGAGKTLSAILSSRVIDAKLTVICCPNNVIENWERNIKLTYPGSVVLSKDTNIGSYDADAHIYVILNYEFFQKPKTERMLKELLESRRVDFVIIDEVHFSKQRDDKRMTLRKKVIAAFLSEAGLKNNDLHVLGMSATPVINNLFEGKTLIELVTGVHHDDLQAKATVPNCISLYQKFVSYGIRWVPRYDCKLNLVTERIDCNDFLPEIRNNALSGSLVDLEAILMRAKMPFILKSLKPKTVIYTHYIQDILIYLQDTVESAGWRVARFTGEHKELEDFIDGNADVLIASSCVGTGIDGLQRICNRLIVACLPWTHAEFQQLKGRVYRQGQVLDHVDVIVPLTFADLSGDEWSWCASRWNRIQFKKSIADAAVDGVIPEGHLRTPEQAYKDIMLWLERLDRGEFHEVERSKIVQPLSEVSNAHGLKKMGDLSRMNSQVNRATSDETNQRFRSNPEEWHHYHAVYREDRKSWPIVPYEEAIQWCNKRSDLIIGDFGCGEALLAEGISNKVYSFDHVAINEKVIACDMCHVPLEDANLHAAIFSLSLMGVNFVDYLKEAHRCLKLDGHLWIAEPASRVADVAVFEDLLFRLGFDTFPPNVKGKFLFVRAVKTEREMNLIALESLGFQLALA